MSFLVTLSPDAEIKDWVIVPSRIQVQRRLTYHEVENLLPEDRQLAALSHLTRRLKERRLARGGYELKLPEVWVTFAPHGEIQVIVEDQETTSRQAVAEAMVLANSLAAQFLADQGVAAIFRGQPEPREPIKSTPDKVASSVFRCTSTNSRESWRNTQVCSSATILLSISLN